MSVTPSLDLASAGLRGGTIWRSALLASLIFSQVRAQGVAANSGRKVEQLETLNVIGSRLDRIDDETIAPVVNITRDEIELAGYQSLGEMIRQLPYSNSTSVDPQFGIGLASGATSLNLRGLGANSALVLVNGRRAAPYGLPGGTGFTTLFDFNSVPLSAIERVEILKDGASALYGADAVAGVVNIKLRQHHSGLSVSGLYGSTTDTDSGLQSVNLTWGTTVGKTDLLLVADWQSRHALFLRDREFSRTADGRQFGGQDGRSATGYPGYVVVPTKDTAGRVAVAGTITNATISPAGGALLTTPAVGDFARGANLFNFNEDTVMLPEYTRTGIYARLRHEANERLFVFGEAALRQNRSEFVQAASTVVNTNELGTGAGGVMRLPFDNPYNPFGVDIDNFRFRLVEQGPRVRDIESTTSRFLAGAGGKLGTESWTWESAVLYSKNKIVVDDLNSALDVQVQTLLNKTSRTNALNPFGPSAPGVAESLATTVTRHAAVDVWQADWQTSGRLWRAPAGDIRVATGAEFRRESSRDRPDPRTVALQVVASGSSTGLSASRRVASAYLEFSIPILRNLEAQLAGRHEEYSDFGSATKPKLALKYRPAKSVLLRAAFGQSFRAPDLAQLFTAHTVTFSALVHDPLRPNDPMASVRQINGGNPALQAELANSLYAGAVLTVPGVGGLELSVDLWRFRHTNLIGAPNIAQLLDLETSAPTGRVLRNAPPGDGLPGTINSASLTFRNVSEAMTDGVDFALRYTRATELGAFTLNTAVTFTHSYTFNDVELVKTNAFPMFRGNGSLQWTRESWSAAVHAHYVDGYAEPAFSIFGPGKPAAHRIPHDYTFSPQVSYRLGAATKLTLGARNVFDRAPPLALGKPEMYDNLQSTGEGRFVYLRISRDF